MIAADIMHLLHLPLDTLRRERWSDFLAWHAQAARIAKVRAM